MMLHLADAVHDGFQKILLRTVDTDVVVLAMAATTKLKIKELWDREALQVYTST